MEDVIEDPDAVKLIDVIDAFAGAFLGTCLAVGIAILPLLGGNALNAAGLSDGLYLLTVVVSTIILEGRFVWRLWATLARGEFPLGPAVARRVSGRLRWLGPIAALWWLAHFLASVFAIVIVTSRADPGDIAGVVIGGIMAAGIGIGGNVYLALALKSLTWDDRVVERWWKHRFLLDAIVAVFTMLFVSMMP